MVLCCDGLRRQFARVNEAPVTGCSGGSELVPGLGTGDVLSRDALLVEEMGGPVVCYQGWF